MKKKQLDILLARYRKFLKNIDDLQQLTQQCGHGFLKGKILEKINYPSPDKIWIYDTIIEYCLAGIAEESRLQHEFELKHPVEED